MSLTIYTNGNIAIDGQDTGLGLSQTSTGTKVFTREDLGRKYKLHAMPHERYSAAHDNPTDPRTGKPTGAAGRAQLEADIRALMVSL